MQVSLATPNGSGKSSVVIPALVLGWLTVHTRGKVVLTTADGKQLDGQVMPALESYRGHFHQWKFQQRAIYTPSGGQFIAFTTDQAGRAEGWHKIDNIEGPLLIIVDEAKTVQDDIFTAIDRCTYNGILLTSSPGRMAGRFYESQMNPALGFKRIRVGLKDCPHITQDKIARVVAQHGADSPFTRSTLHGEFMEAEGEGRFDRAGLEALREMAETGHAQAQRGILTGDGISEFGNRPCATHFGDAANQSEVGRTDLSAPCANGRNGDHAPSQSEVGRTGLSAPGAGGGLAVGAGSGRLGPAVPTALRAPIPSSFHPDPNGWLWMSEPPIPGCSYIAFCDPMTGEQSEGSKQRDTHAAGILRAPYMSGPAGINRAVGNQKAETQNAKLGNRTGGANQKPETRAEALRDAHGAMGANQSRGFARRPWCNGGKPGAVEDDLELVAAIYVPSTEEHSGAACRWDNDILAARLAMLLRFYGNCLCICEANNSGAEVMRLLLLEGCRLWRREKLNHRVSGRKMLDVVGFLTTSATKNHWVGALGTAIREQTLVCKFHPAVQQCATFILNEKGRGEAQAGCHDDWCTGLGMGIHQIHAATQLAWPAPPQPTAIWTPNAPYGSHHAGSLGPGKVGAIA